MHYALQEYTDNLKVKTQRCCCKILVLWSATHKLRCEHLLPFLQPTYASFRIISTIQSSLIMQNGIFMGYKFTLTNVNNSRCNLRSYTVHTRFPTVVICLFCYNIGHSHESITACIKQIINPVRNSWPTCTEGTH